MLGRDMPILVVDDNATFVRVVCGLLTNLGYLNFHAAYDVEQARERLRAETFGLVICDWTQGDGTGLDLAREAGGKALVTVAAWNVEAVRGTGLSWLVKPFTAAELMAKLPV